MILQIALLRSSHLTPFWHPGHFYCFAAKLIFWKLPCSSPLNQNCHGKKMKPPSSSQLRKWLEQNWKINTTLDSDRTSRIFSKCWGKTDRHWGWLGLVGLILEGATNRRTCFDNAYLGKPGLPKSRVDKASFPSSLNLPMFCHSDQKKLHL